MLILSLPGFRSNIHNFIIVPKYPKVVAKYIFCIKANICLLNFLLTFLLFHLMQIFFNLTQFVFASKKNFLFAIEFFLFVAF